ncbi:MAG: hypothetical protein LBI91_03760 [Spirochaetaceae bacterium]|jgi:hypothetical protein|nr:hypothetical protein [Spirochaetaceae bacterium]
MVIEGNREPEMGLTFEKVWAMFQETDRKFERMAEDTDRKFERMVEDTDRRYREMERQFRETDRKISKLGSRVGELVEHLVSPNILEKFKKLGFSFGKAAPDVRFTGPDNLTVAEVDILLENGDVALAVEVKTKLTVDDVKDHINRMEKLRRYADGHGDGRRLMGAVAGAIVPDGVKSFALKSGFYVIEQAGDTAKIDVPDGFVPREW